MSKNGYRADVNLTPVGVDMPKPWRPAGLQMQPRQLLSMLHNLARDGHIVKAAIDNGCALDGLDHTQEEALRAAYSHALHNLSVIMAPLVAHKKDKILRQLNRLECMVNEATAIARNYDH